jgi:cytoskeletal protein CcmA (bactofilin family)
MFRKAKNKSDTTAPKITKSRESIPTIITQDVHILGNIVSDGVVDLSGAVDGNIRCDTLNLRENGVIKGEITAGSVYIQGTVKGLIRAKNVNLLATCKVEGIIIHEQLSIADGAFVDGKFKRSDRMSLPTAGEETVDDDDNEGDGSNDGLDPFNGNPRSSAANGTVAPKLMENIRLIR